MQEIEKKRRRSGSRMMLMGIALLVLIIAGAAVLLLLRREERAATAAASVESAAHDTRGLLSAHSDAEVASFTVTLQSGETWTATPEAEGLRVDSGGSAFLADRTYAKLLLLAVSTVEYQSVVTEDFTQYAEQAAAFGLQPPREIVAIRYTDGETLTLRIGGRLEWEDTVSCYMLADGRPELFTLDASTASDLYIEAAVLRRTAQPTLHTARIDRIQVQTGDNVREWQLESAITDPDAADRWTLIQPFRYAADGEAITSLKRNLANLRMGAYVADATPEALAEYGLDQPDRVITVHQAAGTVMATGESGAVYEEDWDAGTFTLCCGASKSDLADYVLWDGIIYTMPAYMISAVTQTDPMNTLTRYPVLTSLSNLKRLTVETDSRRDVWEVTRGEEGDPGLTLNGSEADWTAFSVRYGRLMQVTVSGVLPEEWDRSAQVHTRLTFETETGAVHTLALSDFDRLHDVVWVDGQAVFYLRKNALTLED